MDEMMKRLQVKRADVRKETKDPKRVLDQVLMGRAWEVLEVAERQYPEAAHPIKRTLARQVSAGELRGISGGKLPWFFRCLGMNVRLETQINILEHGKLKTIGEKLKES